MKNITQIPTHNVVLKHELDSKGVARVLIEPLPGAAPWIPIRTIESATTTDGLLTGAGVGALALAAGYVSARKDCRNSRRKETGYARVVDGLFGGGRP